MTSRSGEPRALGVPARSPEPAIRVPTWAPGVCAGVHAVGCRDVVYVPDNPLSHVLRIFGAQYPDVRLILATREEEAFGIAAGLHLGGRKPAVLLQSSGLGNSLNAITSLLLPYQIPVLMVVSMRGDEGEWNAAQMPMGRAVRDILDAIGVAHVTVESPEGAAETVRRAGATAFDTSVCCACLLPKRLTAAEPDPDSDPRSDPDSDPRSDPDSDPKSDPDSDPGPTPVRPQSDPTS